MIAAVLVCVGLFIGWHVFVGFVRFVDAIAVYYQYERKNN